MFHMLESDIVAKKMTDALVVWPQRAHVGANENVPSDVRCQWLIVDGLFKHHDDHAVRKVTFC